jgi:hypothetical protein
MKRIRIHVVSAIIAAAALSGFGAAAEAQPYARHASNEVRFRAGVFIPEGGKGYWDDSFEVFDGEQHDFLGGAFGFDYLHEIAPFLDIMLGSSFYYADHDLAYRDFEDEHGRSIIHTTRIQTSSFDAGLVFRLAPRHAPIVPYIGGGGTVLWYELIEEGDFVDFDRHPPRIFTDHFHTQDIAYGWYALAGLEFPVGHGFAFFAEGRWQDAHASLGEDFSGFGNLDLTGAYVTFGGAWRF